MIKLLGLPLIVIGVIILIRSMRKTTVADIEVIELAELSKIWIDEKPLIQKEEIINVVKAIEIEVVNYDEDTGEIFEDEPKLSDKFLDELMGQINITDSDGRYGVFTLFDTDNVFISQKSLSIIADNLAVTEDELLAELQKDGYADSGYKLYKVYYKDNKPLVYRNLNIKLFCTEDIEKRKGKKFNITNIEEVKSA